MVPETEYPPTAQLLTPRTLWNVLPLLRWLGRWLQRRSTGKFFVLPWGMDQSFSEGSIQSEGYCSNSILQNCLRNTGCAKDYRDVFLQTAKRLGAQKTALLSLANLAAEQAGKSGGNNIRHWTNVVHIITALGKYSRAQAVAHSAHTAAAPSSDKSSSS